MPIATLLIGTWINPDPPDEPDTLVTRYRRTTATVRQADDAFPYLGTEFDRKPDVIAVIVGDSLKYEWRRERDYA